MSDDSLRDRIRSLRVLQGDFPEFDTNAAPEDPLALLEEWLVSAIDAEVSQPHAMTLATATASGIPSARTLLLKDLTDEGLWFATMANSPKGIELESNGRCALVLYWREQGRQIRVTGTAKPGPRQVSRVDFLSRHPNARAAAIAGRQSTPIVDEEGALASAAKRIEREPNHVPVDWNAYVVAPETVEFWQAGPERQQLRMLYTAGAGGWSHELIWP